LVDYRYDLFIFYFVVGLTYACTYFGRYNINVLNTTDVRDSFGIDVTQYGIITTTGYIVYAIFVVINGYFVDEFVYLLIFEI
jgi:sugar phosphate permease